MEASQAHSEDIPAIIGILGRPLMARTVTSLANLLRRSGSKVLDDSSSLSLTWTVYQQVTTALNIFQDYINSHQDKEILDVRLMLDLEFLQSFMGRVPGIRLHHSTASEWNSGATPGSLSRLVQLRSLYLARLPLQLVEGLASLQPSLVLLSIERCHLSLSSLLSTCLSSLPTPTPTPWPSLTSLTLQHCSLPDLGASLALLPALTHLDCSHNRLKTTEGLQSLPMLSSLLLGFNLLPVIPSLHPEAPLTILSMAYNRLEQLTGLDSLSCLKQLDLAANCLMHHDALAPISSLGSLIQLDLRSNPVSRHPTHRDLAASWLHPSLATVCEPPVLDTVPLSRQEMVMVGSSRLLVSSCLPVTSPCDDSIVSCVEEEEEEYHRSVSCTRSRSREGSLVSGLTSTTSRSRRKARRKAREAVIEDQKDCGDTDTSPDTNTEDRRELFDNSALLAQLRNTYGGDQAQEAGAGGETGKGKDDLLQDLLGITDRVQEEASTPPTNNSPQIKTVPEIIVKKEDKTGDSPTLTVNCDQPEGLLNVSSESGGIYSTRADREVSPQVVRDAGVQMVVRRDIPGADTGQQEQLVLSVGQEYIREQELGPRNITRVKWFLHSVEQAQLLTGAKEGEIRLHLLFNTVRRDRRERVYSMTEVDYSLLMSLVGPVLEAAAAQTQAVTTQLQCVRCQSVFSQCGAGGCPVCGSNMVLETQQEKPEEGEHTHRHTDEVAMGIPVCEALDLEALDNRRASTPNTHWNTKLAQSSVHLGTDMSPVKAQMKPSVTVSRVTVDIHNHVVKPRDTELPDLLPRPQPPITRQDSVGDIQESSSEVTNTSEDSRQSHSKEGSKEKSVSPGLHRSESSSDISVLSNPSECSIEVIDPETISQPVVAEYRTVAVSPLSPVCSTNTGTMQESCSSSGLTSSINSQSGAGSKQTSNRRKLEDTSSVEEGDSTFHSCRSETESEMEDGDMTAVCDTSQIRMDTTLLEPHDDSPYESPVETAKEVAEEEIVQKEDEDDEDDEEGVEKEVMNWNYMDYSLADHRLLLFCDLSLFREGETMLLLARGLVRVRSAPSNIWPGLMVVTNKRIHLLRITGQETDEPGRWLEIVSSCNILRLSRLVGLVGGMGLGLELGGDTRHTVHPTLYRLASLPSMDTYTMYGEPGDSYYLILRSLEAHTQH